MKGTIAIKVNGENLEIHVKMSPLDLRDKMALMDGMARALQADPLEKQMIGLMLAQGGLQATGLADVDETMIDLSAIRKQKGKQENETDSR